MERKIINDHLTLLLGDGYELRREPTEDDSVKWKLLYGVEASPDGEETSEISFSLITDREGELEEEKRNWSGSHHLAVTVKITEAQNLLWTTRALLVAVIAEYNRHACLFATYKVISDREEMEAFADLAARHLNTILPGVIIDGTAGTVECFSGRALLEIGDLAEPMDEEAAQRDYMERLQKNRPLQEGEVSFQATYRDPITGRIVRDLFWERAGAESGDPEAMVKLGVAYLTGDGVAKDPEKACDLFLRAAEMDEPVAQFNMGIQFARGEGVKRDFATAIDWMEQARLNGDTDAPTHLKLMKNALEIQRRAYEGDGEAQARFSTLLANYPSDANVKESVEMARRSAAQGCPRGFHALGTRYDYGMGVEKDPVKAAEIYKKGADLGSPECQYCYAVCLKNGSGVPQDDEAALMWAVKAAEQGHAAAAASISLESGNSPRPIMPVERIIGYLLKAEETDPGDVRVAAQLGVQYINLEPSDYEKSIFWYERAAELGDEKGRQMANLYRFRQKLIDEGRLAEDVDVLDFVQFLQDNDLVVEAFGFDADK